MKRAFKSVSIFLVFTILFSCERNSQVTKEEMVEYVKDPKNGLYKAKQIKDLLYIMQYRPTDLMVANDIKNEVDSVKLQKVIDKYSSHYYFVLSISRNGKDVLRQVADAPQYNELLQLFSFHMQEFVSLTTRKDTFEIQDYIYQNNYGMSKSSNFLLAFSKEIPSSTDTIHINVADLGLGAGNQDFEFTLKDIHKAPSIKY